MHLLDEILPPSVWISGYLGAAGIGAAAIRRLVPGAVPKVAVVTSAFVAVSYVHVPLPLGIAGTSVHLSLNGLVGILLGMDAIPAVAVAVLLQAITGHGGIQPLGFMMLALGSGAVLGQVVFHIARGRLHARSAAAAGFLAGAVALYWSSFVVFIGLWLAGTPVHEAARLFLIAHAGLAVVEGVITAVIVAFLQRVKPSVFDGTRREARSPVFLQART